MVEAFKVMNGTHPDLRSFKKIYKDGWEAKSKEKATLLLNISADFEFIVGIIILYCLIHPITPITQQLQKSAADVVNAYTEVKDCISDLDYNSVKDKSSQIYQQAIRMGIKLSAV